METETILELRNITKEYPGVKALKDVSFSFRKGEVHAIVGENGAGKSTLIKIISGAIQPNCGKIIFDGTEYSHMTPTLSQSLGIGVIYQEFNLVPYLSIAENIFLGKRLTKGITIDRKLMNEKAKQIIQDLGIGDIDVNIKVQDLKVAYQQIVEIAKTITNNVKLLILDEPTAPLTNREIDAIFALIRRLKESGVTVIYISHRLEEIFQISDRVSIMRDGEYIETKNTADTSKEELINSMVGRELSDQYPKIEKKTGEVALEVRHLRTSKLKDISFQLHSGEILGFAGLVNSGRTETARAIFGADPIQTGEIHIFGKRVKIKSPRDGIRAGLALIPEDRKRHGALLEMSIKENISLIAIRSISHGWVIDNKADADMARKYIDELSIKAASMDQLVKNLSGGNQQKVVLAKSMASCSKIILFDEPTRGIDVGAKYEIYTLMNQLAKEGMAIIMISSDMPELLGMSDRIVVMHEGSIAGELSKEEATQNKVLALASGNN